MLIIGIDPGATGAIVTIPLYAIRQTRLYPLEEMSLSDVAALFSEIRYGGRPGEDSEYNLDTQVEVWLENPRLPATNRNASNKAGKQINFGLNAHQMLSRSVGQMEGLCTAFNWRPNLISPQKWQNALDCRTGGDKNITLAKARECFYWIYKRELNGRTKSLITKEVADALLIGLYGYLQYAKYVPNHLHKFIPTNLPDEDGNERRQPVSKLRTDCKPRGSPRSGTSPPNVRRFKQPPNSKQ